jgi:hypothetical protein
MTDIITTINISSWNPMRLKISSIDGYSNIQYHTVPYSNIQYHTIPYSNIQYHTVTYSNIQYHTVTYSNIHSNALRYATRRTVVDRQPAYHNDRSAASSWSRTYLYQTSCAGYLQTCCQWDCMLEWYRKVNEEQDRVWKGVIVLKMTVLSDVSLEGYNTTTKHLCQSTRCPFTCKLDLNVRKTLQLRNSFLCGAETWTLRKLDLKYFGSFEMRC